MAEINTTVQAIFDKAMYLIDAQAESDGKTVTGDTKEYQVRTIGILNTLIDEVYPYSSNYSTANGRPALPDITAFTDSVDLDPVILRAVLPNGLAAKLLSEENPGLADYFQMKYEELLKKTASQLPASFEDIQLPFSPNPHGEFGSWPY